MTHRDLDPLLSPFEKAPERQTELVRCDFHSALLFSQQGMFVFNIGPIDKVNGDNAQDCP
jgi:hypothetical protein